MGALLLNRVAEFRTNMKGQQPLTIPESLAVLADGFSNTSSGFAGRDRPSVLSGVSFIRVAGQAIDLNNGNRYEIKKILEQIVPGGAFLVLGHGNPFKCGAVAAKQLALKEGGQLTKEPEIINKLIERVCPDVLELNSPEAEIVNARYQAQKILKDPEFREIIDRKNITVVAAVCTDRLTVETQNKNNGFDPLNYHPKLRALEMQLGKVIKKAQDSQMPLDQHYAHAAFAFDPSKLRKVLDPHHPFLEIGGICCVDARLAPLTPDGPRYLFRLFPNQGFYVTVAHVEKNGDVKVEVSSDDGGSLVYALTHVKGIDSRSKGENKGNGHIVCLDSSLALVHARATRKALREIHEIALATNNGTTISLAGFDGKGMIIVNEAYGIQELIEYKPKLPILQL